MTPSDTGDARMTETDTNGSFEARFLLVGSYEVQVETPKSKKLICNGVSVTTDEVVSIQLELTLGETSQSVNVTADVDRVQRSYLYSFAILNLCGRPAISPPP